MRNPNSQKIDRGFAKPIKPAESVIFPVRESLWTTVATGTARPGTHELERIVLALNKPK